MYRINNDKRVAESSKMIYEAIRELSYKKDYQVLRELKIPINTFVPLKIKGLS